MPPRFRSLLLAWLLLILLGAAQFGVSFLPLGPSVRPAILALAAAMIVTVALAFMRRKLYTRTTRDSKASLPPR